MKIICKKADLVKAVQTVSKAVPMPLFWNVFAHFG